MDVRCTLLGHKYGDAEIEREREERGEEAVVTIREVETCSRCGDRSIVSENKEVTSVAGADADTPDDADAAPTSEPRPTEPDSGDPVAAESVEDADLDAGPEESSDGAADAPEEGPEHDPETDDGVILDDDGDEAEPEEREYGEWPDAEEDHASAEADPAAADAEDEPTPWPDSDEDADEGYDAAPPDEEADVDVEYPGAADADPDASDEAAGDAGPGGADDAGVESSEDASEAGAGEIIDDEPTAGGQAPGDDQPADDGEEFERAHEAGSPSTPSTGGTVLYCPSCGYRDPSRDGSLREGDICPECRKGYLAAGE